MYAQITQQINIEDINAIARDASEAIMEIYKDPSAWDVQHKEDTSPITKADIVANTLICSRLEQLSAFLLPPLSTRPNHDVSYSTAHTNHFRGE